MQRIWSCARIRKKRKRDSLAGAKVHRVSRHARVSGKCKWCHWVAKFMTHNILSLDVFRSCVSFVPPAEQRSAFHLAFGVIIERSFSEKISLKCATMKKSEAVANGSITSWWIMASMRDAKIITSTTAPRASRSREEEDFLLTFGRKRARRKNKFSAMFSSDFD